jgi:hypothetical protein
MVTVRGVGIWVGGGDDVRGCLNKTWVVKADKKLGVLRPTAPMSYIISKGDV